MTRRSSWLVVAAALAACTADLQTLNDVATPLARLTVHVKGDIAALHPKGPDFGTPNLRAQVVWGATWNPDPFCTLAMSPFAKKPEALPLDASMTAVAAAGCRDVFGFIPGQPGPSAAVGPDGVADIDIMALPPASVLVGTPAARIVYGAVVVYDDRNADQQYRLLRTVEPRWQLDDDGPGSGGPNGQGGQGGQGQQGGQGGQGGGNVNAAGGPQGSNGQNKQDFFYATSFVSMLAPHARIAYREGAYNSASFYYPMLGCAAPPGGYSAIAVSGSPLQSTCDIRTLEAKPIELALQPTETVRQSFCRAEQVRYREPSAEVTPDFSLPWACLEPNELVIADKPGECKGLTHLQLQGCRADKTCKEPNWPMPAQLPPWWPCGDPRKVAK